MTIKYNTATKESGKPSENTLWLEGVGWVYGKKVEDLKDGDTLVWNYGSTSKFVGFGKETAKFIVVKEEYKSFSGSIKIGERKFKKDRIIGIAN